MTQMIEQLQIDHRNMRQLTQVLEEQIDIFSGGGIADFDFMRQVIDYTLHYPNLIHHPREDLLFQRLVTRDPAATLLIDDLIGEHAELAQLTKRFAAALHNVAQDVELPRQWLETLARNYIATTRQHMATEEQSLFPRALATLSDADWAELDARVLAGNDPLFGSPMEQHYLDLHRRIMRTCS